MLQAIPLFKAFECIGINHLPRIYISNNDYLSKQKASDETTVNLQRIIRAAVFARFDTICTIKKT